MTRPILLFVACLAAASVSARPQFKLTPRELQAFETVLGGSHPVSISSAIPVMAFTDQKASKFVNLPQGKHNGLGIERSGGSPIPAEKIHFEESFGRSATKGPVLNAGPETISHGVLGGRSFDSVSTFDDDSFTLTSGSTLDSFQKRQPQTFSELNFGFQPGQSSISSSGKTLFSSSSPLVQSSFSPSPQITHGGTFRPSIFAGNFEETTFHDDGLPATFDSGLTHGLGISSGFGTSLASSGLGSKSPIDVKEVSVTGKNIGEDDNLYRHHLGTSLLPTHGAGPATIAAGKLLASRPKVGNTIGKAFGHALDDRTGSDLVTRSLDSQRKVTSSNTVNPSRSNDEKVNIAAKNDSQAVVGASIAVESSQARLRGTVESVPVGIRPQSRSKLESSVSGFINQGRSAAAKGQQDQSQKSQQNSKSPRAESSSSGIGSFFKTGSLQIPNVQLPLQTASRSLSGNLKSGSPEPKSESDIVLDTEKFETAEDKPALLTLHNFGPPQKASGSSISSGTESQSSLSGSNRSEQLLKLLRERAIAQNVEETAQPQTVPSNSAKSSTSSRGTSKPLSQSPELGKNNFSNQATKEPQTVTPKTTKPSFSIPGSVRNPAQPSEAQQKTQSSISLQNKQIADTLAKLTTQQGSQPIVIANSPNGASTPFSVAQIHQLLKSSQLSNIASNLQQQSSPSAGSAGSLIKSTSAGTTVVRATPGQSNTAISTSAVKSASSAGSLGGVGGLGGAGGLGGVGGLANVGSLGGVGGLAGLGGLGGLGALAGGSAAGGQPTIIVKTLELDAKDADPSSDAFKAALAKATKEARLELGVSSSEELGVGGADLASLFGKRRRKRQLFGGESSSNAQSFGNALSTGAGIFELDDDELDNTAHEE